MAPRVLLIPWYRDKIEGIRNEILVLLRSPAKYLDAVMTAEPTSGIELYERYDNLRDMLRRELPEFEEQIPLRRYQTTNNGSLSRPDLESLDRDLKLLLAALG